MWTLMQLAFGGGFFHPAQVAGESEAYASASQRSAQAAGVAQKRARALAASLTDYEEALDLLGPVAPPEERARLAQLKQEYNRGFGVLQHFVDQQVDGFDAAFSRSLDRAVQALPGATRCRRDVPDGPRFPGCASARNPIQRAKETTSMARSLRRWMQIPRCRPT
jgi:hypothetical protein